MPWLMRWHHVNTCRRILALNLLQDIFMNSLMVLVVVPLSLASLAFLVLSHESCNSGEGAICRLQGWNIPASHR